MNIVRIRRIGLRKNVSVLYRKIKIKKKKNLVTIRKRPEFESYKNEFSTAFKEEFGRNPELRNEKDKRFFISYVRHRMFREKGKYYDHNKLHLKGAAETKLHSLLERGLKKRNER